MHHPSPLPSFCPRPCCRACSSRQLFPIIAGRCHLLGLLSGLKLQSRSSEEYFLKQSAGSPPSTYLTATSLVPFSPTSCHSLVSFTSVPFAFAIHPAIKSPNTSHTLRRTTLPASTFNSPARLDRFHSLGRHRIGSNREI